MRSMIMQYVRTRGGSLGSTRAVNDHAICTHEGGSLGSTRAVNDHAICTHEGGSLGSTRAVNDYAICTHEGGSRLVYRVASCSVTVPGWCIQTLQI